MSTDDKDPMKSFTSRKLDWINGISIDPEMTSHDLHVALEIARCLSVQSGCAIIADETIAKATKTTRGYVLAARKRLQARGWLDWKATRTANVYSCNDSMVDAMIDLRTHLRDQRNEARFERLPSRQATKKQHSVEQHAVDPSEQHNGDTVDPSEQQAVDYSEQYAVDPSEHTHPQCSTEIVHQEEMLPTREICKKEVVEEEPGKTGDDETLAAAPAFHAFGSGTPTPALAQPSANLPEVDEPVVIPFWTGTVLSPAKPGSLPLSKTSRARDKLTDQPANMPVEMPRTADKTTGQICTVVTIISVRELANPLRNCANWRSSSGRKSANLPTSASPAFSTMVPRMSDASDKSEVLA